jgi:hypothetical protein
MSLLSDDVPMHFRDLWVVLIEIAPHIENAPWPQVLRAKHDVNQTESGLFFDMTSYFNFQTRPSQSAVPASWASMYSQVSKSAASG